MSSVAHSKGKKKLGKMSEHFKKDGAKIINICCLTKTQGHTCATEKLDRHRMGTDSMLERSQRSGVCGKNIQIYI